MFFKRVLEWRAGWAVLFHGCLRATIRRSKTVYRQQLFGLMCLFSSNTDLICLSNGDKQMRLVCVEKEPTVFPVRGEEGGGGAVLVVWACSRRRSGSCCDVMLTCTCCNDITFVVDL